MRAWWGAALALLWASHGRPGAAEPREAASTDEAVEPSSLVFSPASARRGGSSPQRPSVAGRPEPSVGSGGCAGIGLARGKLCLVPMTGWRAGVVALAAASGLVPGMARPGGSSAADEQAYRAYQAELQRLLAAESSNQAPAAAPGRSVADCKLFQGAPERVPAQECMSCHAMHTTHPVEIDYEAARFKPQSALRAGSEVVRRGVFLPDGKVQCVTCHDARSRWAYHLALPPDALVRPSVNTRDPSTYEGPVALSRPHALPAGTAVSPTPLCKVCHTLGE